MNLLRKICRKKDDRLFSPGSTRHLGDITRSEDYEIFNPEKKELVIKPKVPRVRDIQHKGLRWIDIIHPTKNEIEMLEKEFEFHELLLEDCLTEHQRAQTG